MSIYPGAPDLVAPIAPRLVSEVPGPRSRELSARLAAVECPAFEARREARGKTSGEAQGAIVLSHGRGDVLWDVDGNAYVDFVAGFGALALGHAPPVVVHAFRKEVERLPLALGDVYASEAKVLLCEALAALYPEPGARVLLGLSGADAVTAALKTAVLATKKPGVVAFHGSYHGLSHGPLAACGLAPAFREPFAAQLGSHVTFAPYPGDEAELHVSLSAVERALRRGDVGLVLVEPLLGRGGCVVPPPSFLRELRTLATSYGALLAADEIWTGLGRSGTMLASLDQSDGSWAPDLVCLGKALGAGFPVSACIGRAEAFEAWGTHGGTAIHTATHFGAPPACSAALAALHEIERLSLPARARRVGDLLRNELTNNGFVVSGRGLMLGIDLRTSAHALAVGRRLLSEGWLVLTGGTAGNVLTLSPALTLSEGYLSPFVDALRRAVLTR